MTQVAIVIDLPFHDVEQLTGHNTLRIAEDTAREFRKQVAVDDHLSVRGVFIGNELKVEEVFLSGGAEVELDAEEVKPEKPKRTRKPKTQPSPGA